MLLRNLDPQNGHCNGTRYIVNQLHQHIIEADITTSSNAGRTIFIPRITHVIKENEYPFKMRRKQFPIQPALLSQLTKVRGNILQNWSVSTK